MLKKQTLNDIFLFSVFFLLLSFHSLAQAPTPFDIELFSGNLSYPVAIEFANDSRMFVVQQRGVITIIDSNGVISPKPFLDIQSKVNFQGEMGLLGLAFSPNFKNDRTFYLDYNLPVTNKTVIARYKVSISNPDSAVVSSEQVLLTITQPFTNHKGGCLKFGHDGYLYISSGDGGSGGDPYLNGQNKKSHLGKILRIDVNTTDTTYHIPASNPFINDTSAYPEVWAYGLRNPWRMSFDREKHNLWIGDVGQGLWEEIDKQPSGSTGGENYGWKCYEGNHVYDSAGCGPLNDYVPPVTEYSHSAGCSVTGGFVYRGNLYSNLYGYYFLGDYCSGRIGSIHSDSVGLNYQAGIFSGRNWTAFGEDRYGELYAADYATGKIFKLKGDTCSPRVSVIKENGMFFCFDSIRLSSNFHPSLKYQWFYNGDSIKNEIRSFMYAKSGGNYSVIVTTAYGCSKASTVFSLAGCTQAAYDNYFNLYPVPSSDLLTMEYYSIKERIIQVIIYDVAGKEVLNSDFTCKGGMNKISLPVTAFAKGIYTISVTSDNYEQVRKFVKGM